MMLIKLIEIIIMMIIFEIYLCSCLILYQFLSVEIDNMVITIKVHQVCPLL